MPVASSVLGFAATTAAWARAAIGHPDLGDVRRGRRLEHLVMDLVERPNASIPHACKNWASTKAAYRLWATVQRVTDLPERIRAGHTRATKTFLAGAGRVLAVQDTTTLNWSHHPSTRGLGPISTAPKEQGLLVHSTLAVTTAGVPLGLLDQQVWARDVTKHGKKHTRRIRATAEKESQKWLDGVTAAQTDLPAGVELIHVGDAESDVYDLFVHAQATPGTQFLIRACQDRRTTTGAHLWATLEAQPIVDIRAVELARTPERVPRQARLALRWTRVTLQPPRQGTTGRTPVTVDAVLVVELDPPEGVAPVVWLLLTTVAVLTTADAWERVTWYTYRWRIERYHLVLKSGCRIEDRQLQTAERLTGCLAVYAIVAVRVLQLTEQARLTPDAPGTALISSLEWRLLWRVRHPEAPEPPDPPTLRTVVREIAQLGGFLARRGDGEPGVITLWRGLQRLHDLVLGFDLARSMGIENVGNA